ncbi:MAG: dipeptidase [Oscillospiraceae bacterium]
MGTPLFDAHCDTAFETLRKGEGFRENTGHNDLVRGSAFFPRAQVFAIYDKGGGIREKYRRQIEHIKAELSINSDIISLCTSGSDIGSAVAAGKQAALISVEGAELLGCSPEGLIEAYGEGVRIVNLTWNFENRLSGSNAEGKDKGLTKDGIEFVKLCGNLGVTIDLSHISDPGFWDVLEYAEGPVIASHSNSRTVFAHPRNLTDDMFKALVERGSAAGINLYSDFLGEDPDIDTVISHIEHFLELGGEKSVGIGADFDGCDKLPRGIEGIQDMGKLYDSLLGRGFTQSVADDIFFNNFMRIFI